jgi:hypothetical protein
LGILTRWAVETARAAVKMTFFAKMRREHGKGVVIKSTTPPQEERNLDNNLKL